MLHVQVDKSPRLEVCSLKLVLRECPVTESWSLPPAGQASTSQCLSFLFSAHLNPNCIHGFYCPEYISTITWEKKELPLKELGLNITITTEKMDANLTKSNIYHAQWMRQNNCHSLLVLRKKTSELESQVLHCAPKQGRRQQVNALC